MEYTLCKYDRELFWDDKEELMEVIKRVNKEPEIGVNYKINGQVFHVCAISPKKKIAGLREISINDDPEEQFDDDFICPYCGDVFHDAFELSDEGETDCGNCGSTIEYEREFSVSYIVRPKKKSEVVNL